MYFIISFFKLNVWKCFFMYLGADITTLNNYFCIYQILCINSLLAWTLGCLTLYVVYSTLTPNKPRTELKASNCCEPEKITPATRLQLFTSLWLISLVTDCSMLYMKTHWVTLWLHSTKVKVYWSLFLNDICQSGLSLIFLEPSIISKVDMTSQFKFWHNCIYLCFFW